MDKVTYDLLKKYMGRIEREISATYDRKMEYLRANPEGRDTLLDIKSIDTRLGLLMDEMRQVRAKIRENIVTV